MIFLTHLTFLFIESHKIKDRVLLNAKGDVTREWKNLEEVVLHHKKISEEEREVAKVHLASVLGRTYDEVAGYL